MSTAHSAAAGRATVCGFRVADLARLGETERTSLGPSYCAAAAIGRRTTNVVVLGSLSIEIAP